MRILAAAVSLIIAVSSVASAALGAGTSLQVGDTLVYAVTIELQQHHVESGVDNKAASSEASGQGTETITVYAIGQDATAYANVEANFKGVENGRPIDFDVRFPAKILPDGQIRMKSQLGGGISEAINFANTTTQEITEHTLQPGSAWKTVQKTPYVHLTMARKVTGQKVYQGFSAIEVQSIGSGTLDRTADGKQASGTIAISGTSYYDGNDHLLLGEALRTFTVLKPPDNPGAHTNYSAAMNIALSSWTHATPSENGAATSPPNALASPTATPASVPTPGPVPNNYGPTPYPTVTPRLGD